MNETSDSEKISRSFRELLRSATFWKTFAGIAGGVIVGYLYYHYVGCRNGSCAITSNPYMSMLFGGILGLYATNSPCSKGKC